MTLQLSSLQETVTVSGQSPMVEVSTSTTSMNIDAQLQKALPLTEGAFWTDFLQMTPGVLSRPNMKVGYRIKFTGSQCVQIGRTSSTS